jgi:opacity protein-like surface antigen
MIKRVLAVAAVLAFTATLAVAAPVKAKVVSIEGKKVQVELVDAKADWMKKGAPVKFKGGVGRIRDIVEKAVTMNSKNADKLKVGDEIELDKGPATLEGC